MTLSSWDRQALVSAVQRHCHIADAAHAGDLPLCIYLLQMREFYRWEMGLPFGAVLAREDVGNWLSGREALWNELEGQPLQPLPLPTGMADAFDQATVNAVLQPLGLVYGAGLVAPERPSYFVAELLQLGPREVDGEEVSVQVCGRELARGLASPMAMLAPPADDTLAPRIVLRQAALARWLWERFEGHSLHAGAGPFHALAQLHGLDSAEAFNAALPAMLQGMGRMLLLHEVGELRAGRRLGPAWAQMRRAQAGNRRAELRLRAVRDLLADLDTTLPALLNQADDVGLMFWLASFEGHRESLFPGLKQAAMAWQAGHGSAALQDVLGQGSAHFNALADRLLALHEPGSEATAAVAQCLEGPSAVCPP